MPSVPRHPKACRGCRKVKIRCVFKQDATNCERCARLDRTCEAQEPQSLGRPKGSQSKIAVAEFPKAKPAARSGITMYPISSPHQSRSTDTYSPDFACASSGNHNGPIIATPSLSDCFSPRTNIAQGENDRLRSYDQFSANPIQLLAHVAEEETTVAGEMDGGAALSSDPLSPLYTLPSTFRAMFDKGTIIPKILGVKLETDTMADALCTAATDEASKELVAEARNYLNPRRNIKRDLGQDVDPIHLAILSEKEARVFVATYFEQVHPCFPILDPNLHTVDYIRNRSAYLFSAVCTVGASLSPGATLVSKRLRLHTSRMQGLVDRRKCASEEIVQAFVIWVSFGPTSIALSEERLWHDINYTLYMAKMLALSRPLAKTANGLRNDPELVDSLEDIHLEDDAVIRFARNRERLWLHLFLWDCSLALASGKATRFEQNALIKDEQWWSHRLAIPEDRLTSATVVLRRHQTAVSSSIQSYILTQPESSSEVVTKMIDDGLQWWQVEWLTPGEAGTAYLNLLVRHSLLWLYSHAMQLLFARGGDISHIRQQCFLNALSSCDFVCQELQGSKRLWGLSNFFAPMLAFMAITMIQLVPAPSNPEDRIGNTARILGIGAVLACHLEQIGATPPHRLGTSAVLGRQVKIFIHHRARRLCFEDQNGSTGISLANELSAGTSDINLLKLPSAWALADMLGNEAHPNPVTNTSGVIWDDADIFALFDLDPAQGS